MVLVAFDLEGPLSPQDNAYELMALIPEGRQLFERISRYDDLLTLEKRPNYEPGDTLKLILPFLLVHGLREEHIRKVSERASLVSGARECLRGIWGQGWRPCIISTSYAPHALNIADQVGVPPDLVAATPVAFDRWEGVLTEEALGMVLSWQQRILECPSDDDERLKRVLDEFFWIHLIKHPLGIVLDLPVMGGSRKTNALKAFAEEGRIPLNRCVFIGDSITDFHALRSVRDAGGLAVVFNGNEYALPYGTVGVASMDLRAVIPVIEIWAEGGNEAVKEWLGQRRIREEEEGEASYQWLDDRKWKEALPIHRRFREAVRGQAAKLG